MEHSQEQCSVPVLAVPDSIQVAASCELLRWASDGIDADSAAGVFCLLPVFARPAHPSVAHLDITVRESIARLPDLVHKVGCY